MAQTAETLQQHVPVRSAPMRCSIVGHASLYAEAGSTDLLVDPWLLGSCYWRSWWHFPPPVEPREEWLRPRFVYLSHHHFDHFHYPSLRRISRETHVLVPRFGVDVMRGELAQLGFRRVTELQHGDAFELGDDIVVRSYQYGVDDSALVIKRGDTVVADLNDCKVRGRALRQILDDNGPVTLMLKNYSAAQAYPGCYTARDPRDLRLISRHSYLVDFRLVAQELSARYAVPFASMTCFLHPETFARNAEVVLPSHLVQYFEANPLPGTRLVVMAPGDSWNEQDGFTIAPGDRYANFPDRVAEMAAAVRPKLDTSLEDEGRHELRFEQFSAFFGDFVRALPLPIRRLFKGSVVFGVGDELWVIDVRGRRVYRSAELPDDWASLVRTPSGILADAMDKRIVNFVHISMRLAIELNQGGTQTDFLFWGMLTVYELGYFPLRRAPLGRLAGAAWARRREFSDLALSAVGGKSSALERMAGSLMPTEADPQLPES